MPAKPDWLITPTEAIKALKDRVPMPIADYKNLDARIHDQALTSSGVTQVSFLQDMHWLLTNALERGEGLDVFMDQWNKLLGRKGWAPGGNRIRTIFDTNIRKANADGKRARVDTAIAKQTMPYRIWRWRDSVVPRPEHKALHNKAFEADSEFYQAVHFPCDWGCFPGDTLVMTSQGWKPISSILVNDLVLTGGERFNPVTATHSSSYVGDLVRIVSKEGCAIQATPNHRILTLRGWVEAKSLNVDDVLVKVGKGSSFDQIVGYINQSCTSASDFSMSSPLPRMGSGSIAFNAQIKFWQENIDPSSIDMMVKGNNETHCFKMPYHHLLAFCRGDFSIYVSTGICLQMLVEGGLCFLSNILSEKRRSDFELLCNHSGDWTNVFSLPLFGVLVSLLPFMYFLQGSASQFSASRIVSPLLFNSFTSSARNNPDMLEQTRNGSIGDIPSGAQILDCQVLSNIQMRQSITDIATFDYFNFVNYLPEFRVNGISYFGEDNITGFGYPPDGFTANSPGLSKIFGGQSFSSDPGSDRFTNTPPLKLFNSLNDFRVYANSHYDLHPISAIEEVKYTGIVYNLSVFQDESYTLQAATVHNCKCGWFPVSADYVERNNIEIVTNPPDIDTIVGKGFRRGKGGEFDFGELIKNSLSKTSPDLKKAAEKRIGEKADSEDTVVNVPAKGDVDAYSYVRRGARAEASPISCMTVDNKFSGKHKATIKEWIKAATDIQALPSADSKTVAKAKDCQNVCEMIEPLVSFQILGMPTHFKGIIRDGEMVAAAVYTDSKDEVDEDELDPDYSPPGYLSLEMLTATPVTALPNHPLKKEKLGVAAMREMVLESVRRGHSGRMKLSAVPGAIPFYTSVGFKPEGELKTGNTLQPMVLEKAEARVFLNSTLEKRRADSRAIALAPLLAAERAAYPVFAKPARNPPAE
jgi:hypothetical protein